MLSLKEIMQNLEKLNGWELSGNAIEKTFQFQDFNSAVECINRIKELVEKYKISPTIIIQNNSVKVILTTLPEKSLTEKDFQVAEEIDKIRQ